MNRSVLPIYDEGSPRTPAFPTLGPLHRCQGGLAPVVVVVVVPRNRFEIDEDSE